MSKISFTGCQHYSHGNIMKYCYRTQFMNSLEKEILQRGNKEEIDQLKISIESIHKMNNKLIQFHNERIMNDDVVYNVGDFCMYGKSKSGNGEETRASMIIKQLNGDQIFIQGNHDGSNRNTLKTHNEQIILNQNGLRIQVLHDPHYAKIDYDLIINSHIHKLWKIKELYYCGQIRLMINCGVDVWNFYPVKLDEILAIYYRWKKQRQSIKRWETPSIIKELNKGCINDK